MKRFPDRMYHPYWDWEEIGFNMWGTVDNRSEYLSKAIEFTGDADKYGSYMIKVVNEWTRSCEHNLSNRTQNRKAWIGHAACAMAFGCPEDIVREAWGKLTEEQRIAANNKADEAIAMWESKYLEKEEQCQR